MPELKRSMINEALKLVRLYWGLSQVELAETLCISQSMVSEIESGAKTVSLETLERYSNGLGIRMSNLMFFAEEIENEPPLKRGKLIIANRVLKLLDALKPNDTVET